MKKKTKSACAPVRSFYEEIGHKGGERVRNMIEQESGGQQGRAKMCSHSLPKDECSLCIADKLLAEVRPEPVPFRDDALRERIHIALNQERKLGAGHTYRVVRFIAGVELADLLDPYGAARAKADSVCTKTDWCKPMKDLLGREHAVTHGIEPFVVRKVNDSGDGKGRVVGLLYKNGRRVKTKTSSYPGIMFNFCPFCGSPILWEKA